MEQGKSLAAWLVRAWEEEGHDPLGAYEITLGVAVFVSYLALALLPQVELVGHVLFWVLLLGALYYGSRLEHAQLYALGKRRFRTMLELGITWLALVLPLVYTLLLMAWAAMWGWNQLPGWRDGPMRLLLILGFYFLTLGLKLRIRRWMVVGTALCFFTVLVLQSPFLREHLFLATAFYVGGVLEVSGWLKRLAVQAQLRPQPRPVAAAAEEPLPVAEDAALPPALAEEPPAAPPPSGTLPS